MTGSDWECFGSGSALGVNGSALEVNGSDLDCFGREWECFGSGVYSRRTPEA